MIFKSFLLSLVLLLSFNTYAQTITGRVFDNNNKPVSYASVSILQENDSSVVNYATTDDQGSYKISMSVEGEFILKVSSLGYAPNYQKIVLSKGQNLHADITLSEKPYSLKEITVDGHYRGVKYGNDTIRYDVKRFTDGSEVVLGDVLNKLPGIEVDSKGAVKAQGKNVDKILLDGQDFFAGNAQMATKNLTADIAESVEVLNNYSEYSMLNGFQSSEQTVINVGVNKSKYGKISGDVMGGGGINNRYNFKGNLMQLNAKSMLSVIGSFNNTGEEVFSLDDYFRLQGGVNEVMGKSGKIDLSEEERRLLFPQNNTYSRDNGLSAINFSYQPKSNFKLNAYILHNRDKTRSEELNNYKYFSSDQTVFKTRESIQSRNNNRLTSGYFKLDYSPNKTLSMAYKGYISGSQMKEENEYNNDIQSQQINTIGNRNITPIRTQHKIMLMKSLGKNIFLTNARVNYSNNPLRYDIETDSLLLPIALTKYGELYYGEQRIRQNQISGEISSAYFYRINKSYFLQPALGVDYESQKYTSSIYNNANGNLSILEGDSLHSNAISRNYDYYGSLNLLKNTGFFRFKLGLSAHLYNQVGTIKDKINDRNLFRVNPLVEMSLVFSPKHRLNTAFSRKYSSNDIEGYIDEITFDSYNSYRRASNLDYFFNYKYTGYFSYNFFDAFSNTTIIASGAYEKEKNNKTLNQVQKGVLTETNYITSSPNENLFGSLYLAKGLDFIPWLVNFNAGYSKRDYVSYLSGSLNQIETQRITTQASLQSHYNSPLNAEVWAKLEHVENSATLTNDAMYNIQKYGAKLKLKANERLYVESEFEFIKNKLPSYSQNLYMLNSTIKYSLSKKMTLQLKGYNMLNINEQAWRSLSFSNNYEVERYYRQIPGYVILSMGYRL